VNQVAVASGCRLRLWSTESRADHGLENLGTSFYSYERYGRHVGTRTSDLYRVKITTVIGPDQHHLSHATLRDFVAVFRAVLGFFLDVSAVFLALCAALAEDGNPILGCLRWWPWFSGWMRAASFSIRS
jgi:hypothetical protein